MKIINKNDEDDINKNINEMMNQLKCIFYLIILLSNDRNCLIIFNTDFIKIFNAYFGLFFLYLE
jgi:hypothetical protein